MAIQYAWRILRDPESVLSKPTNSFDEKLSDYRLAYAFYERRMFAPGADWSWYLNQRGLYQHTKLVFNPVTPVIDFYVDNVWASANNKDFPSLITPVADGTDEKLIAAVAQLDQWTQWAKSQQEVKSFAAACGNVLVEVIDDLQRQKVTQRTVWPGFVKDIELNDAGDVQSYIIEYEAFDRAENRAYTFKKVVNKETISYFRDDKPFVPEGATAAVEYHPYEFCPAVWIRHSGNGTYGNPAFRDFNKVNHANSLACHLHDNIHKEIESGKIITTIANPKEDIKILTGGYQNADGTINENDTRLDRVLLAAKGDAKLLDMAGMLKLAEAEPYLKHLLISFGDDYPELEYRQILKENAQVSGIALTRLLTPAQNRLDRAAPNYDGQLIKLRQMQAAIAGFRLATLWRNPTPQQAAFAPFNLNSYAAGQLDFNVKPSRLIEPNELEEIEIRQAKANLAVTVKDIFDRRTVVITAGKSEEEADEIMRLKEAEREETLKQMQAQNTRTDFTMPNRPQPRRLVAEN